MNDILAINPFITYLEDKLCFDYLLYMLFLIVINRISVPKDH